MLFWSQEVCAVQFVDVAKVGEHLFGVCHVFVHVVEVAEHEFAPCVELVEGLVGVLHHFEVHFVQFADEHDVVGNLL